MTTDVEARDVARRALAAYGIEAQLRQLAEECCELGAAVNRRARGRDPRNVELAKEAAQVRLMLLQLELALEPGQLGRAFEVEVERLAVRLAVRFEDA